MLRVKLCTGGVACSHDRREANSIFPRPSCTAWKCQKWLPLLPGELPPSSKELSSSMHTGSPLDIGYQRNPVVGFSRRIILNSSPAFSSILLPLECSSN